MMTCEACTLNVCKDLRRQLGLQEHTETTCGTGERRSAVPREEPDCNFAERQSFFVLLELTSDKNGVESENERAGITESMLRSRGLERCARTRRRSAYLDGKLNRKRGEGTEEVDSHKVSRGDQTGENRQSSRGDEIGDSRKIAEGLGSQH